MGAYIRKKAQINNITDRIKYSTSCRNEWCELVEKMEINKIPKRVLRYGPQEACLPKEISCSQVNESCHMQAAALPWRACLNLRGAPEAEWRL
jgi:hypothetical protein